MTDTTRPDRDQIEALRHALAYAEAQFREAGWPGVVDPQPSGYLQVLYDAEQEQLLTILGDHIFNRARTGLRRHNGALITWDTDRAAWHCELFKDGQHFETYDVSMATALARALDEAAVPPSRL